MTLARIYADITIERERQERMVAAGRNQGWVSCADPSTSDEYRLAVLGEEFGEVCKALNEIRTGEASVHDLRRELIEVAACASAWVQGIDNDEGEEPVSVRGAV